MGTEITERNSFFFVFRQISSGRTKLAPSFVRPGAVRNSGPNSRWEALYPQFEISPRLAEQHSHAARHRYNRDMPPARRKLSVPLILAIIAAALSSLQQYESLLVAACAFREHHALDDEEIESDDDDGAPESKRRRLVYERPDYANSSWSRMLDQKHLLEDHRSREARRFRRRFRSPYPFFLAVVEEVKANEWEEFTTDKKDLGGRGTRPCIPVELKVGNMARVHQAAAAAQSLLKPPVLTVLSVVLRPVYDHGHCRLCCL